MEHEDIGKELVSFYNTLLSKPQGDNLEAIGEITRHIPILVTPEKNESLLMKITLEEVERDIMDMPIGNSPCLDGFTTYFCHAC
jgi:hypothetical protein